MFIASLLVFMLIIILIIKINYTLSKQSRDEEKFTEVEAIFTIAFGAFGLLYLLIVYREEIIE
jgi:cbb3-type cytochrome oxidase subunit 3